MRTEDTKVKIYFKLSIKMANGRVTKNDAAVENPFNIQVDLRRGFILGTSSPLLASCALRNVSLFLLNNDIVIKEILDIVKSTQFINPPLTACWPGLKFDVFRRKYPFIIARRTEISWAKIKHRILYNIACLVIPQTLKEDLRKTVREIYPIVLSFFFSLKRINLSFNYERIKMYFSSMCWTAQGTMDYQRTTALLADNKKLSIMERYAVVSNFCLRDKLNSLRSQLPDYVIDHIDNFRPSLFFGLYLCGIEEDYCPFIDEMKNCFENMDDRMFNARLLDRAVALRNRMALQFICENLQISDLVQNISSLILDTLENQKDVPPDILNFLLSKIDDTKICADFGVLSGFRLLRAFAKHSLWHNYFMNIAPYVLKFTLQVPVADAFRTIALCWLKKVIDRNRVAKMLNEFKLSYNIDLSIDYLVNFQELFAVSLFVNDPTCQKLLALNGIEEAKKLLCDIDVMLRLKFGLYLAGKRTLFTLFLRRIFVTEEEFNYFQSLLLWHEAAFIGMAFPNKESNEQ